MTITKLIEVLQKHGDDGSAEVQLSYFADFGSGEQEWIVPIDAVQIDISEESNVSGIVLKALPL